MYTLTTTLLSCTIITRLRGFTGTSKWDPVKDFSCGTTKQSCCQCGSIGYTIWALRILAGGVRNRLEGVLNFEGQQLFLQTLLTPSPNSVEGFVCLNRPHFQKSHLDLSCIFTYNHEC